ncbi:hypothetical protein N1851_012177 [Merluccius polli]|uniref:Uncharacterized protein n=1 Tax=Merluccius polli TaxID=89951 RepID=A0AA47P2F5_MERPO|nr:hypothetical protein N1851_012177 [Merluccius polli]
MSFGVVTEKERDRGYERDEVSFLAGLSLRDGVRSSDIQRELGVEPLLLHVERSQLRWFRHLTPGRLPLEVFSGHIQLAGDPLGRPRTGWRDYGERDFFQIIIFMNSLTEGKNMHGGWSEEKSEEDEGREAVSGRLLLLLIQGGLQASPVSVTHL